MNSRLTPVIVASAMLMESIDGTVIATSLPAIAADIHENPFALKLALTSYLLAVAIFIPASGWVADRFGSRRVFGLSMLVFVAGSILCGASGSLTTFVLARFLQGLGGSMMTPVGRLVVIRSVPRSQMVQAFAYLTMPAMIGPLLGPPLGGFLSTYFDWRWIFWINVPIGLGGVLLAQRYVPDVREASPGRFDWRGLLLAGFGLGGLIFGCTLAGQGLAPPALAVGMIVGGVALLTGYVIYARTADSPLIDLSLLKIPTFRAALFGGTLYRISAGAMPFLLPLMLQLGFGLSPFATGLMTLASAGGALAMKIAAPAILRRMGFRAVLIVNSFVCAVFYVATGLVGLSTPWIVILVILGAGGFFRSLQYTALNAVAYADVENERMSKATSFASTGQQVSNALGVVVAAAAVEITIYLSGSQVVTVDDFRPGYMLIAVMTLTSLVSIMALPKNAAVHLSGRRMPGTRPAGGPPPAARDPAAAE